MAAIWLEMSLTKRLRELVLVVEKISSGNNLRVRTKKLSNDEFGKVTAVFEIKDYSGNVINQVIQEGISAETANVFDEALIKIPQINYNYMIIDEDYPSL